MNKIVITASTLLLVTCLVGCGEEEKTPGQKLDAAIATAKDKMDDLELDKAKAEAKKAAGAAGDAAHHAAESAKELYKSIKE